MQTNWQLRQDPHILNTFNRVESELNDLLASVTSRFEAFRQHSDRMWDSITAAKFQQIRDHVIRSQKTVGGVLCGLEIKLNSWQERLPDAGGGGPIARVEMLFSEILPVLDKLAEMERQGRVSSITA